MAYGYYQPNYYAPTGAMPDMLHQYKSQYQPNMQMPMMQNPAMPQTQAQNGNDMIWVQGESGAKAYLIAPNSTVTLWDSESPTIYIKSADASGVPSMRVLDFTERAGNTTKNEPQHECKCGKDFVKLADFEVLQAKFDDLSAKFEALSAGKEKK